MKKYLILILSAAVIIGLSGCPSATSPGSPPPPVTYSITYDSNSADSGSVPAATVSNANQQALIAGNSGALEKEGFWFSGWSTTTDLSGSDYTPRTPILLTQNITLYARWIPDSTTPIQITYSNLEATTGDIPVDSNLYTSGQKAVIYGTGTLARSGYGLFSWKTAGGTDYRPGSTMTVTNSVTLTADWRAARTFKAQNLTNGSWYDIPSLLLAEGTRSLVYMETAASVSLATAQAIATEFDNDIYAQIETNFGTPADVDTNGKIIIFLLDIQDGYNGTGGYVAGYFDPTHLFSKTTYSVSNEAEMLFIDISPAEPGTSACYETIAHEFQHLINFSNTALPIGGSEQDLWINEGLSSGAEYVYSGAVSESRIEWYNADPVGTIAVGNNFFVWNGYWEEDYPASVLDNYATVSLFFQWLRLHASNGTGIYKEILTSSDRDYQAVTSAAAARIDSSFSSWETLLKTWNLANLICETTGYYGYLNAINVSTPVFIPNANNARWYFSPGESIVSLAPVSGYTPTTGSGASIRYLGVTPATSTLDTTAPYTALNVLTFNANSDNESADQTGYIALGNISYLTQLSSRNVAVNPLPTSWKIDVQIAPGGGVNPATRDLLNSARTAFKPLTSVKKAAK